MAELESFLRANGLWALFLAAALEGELTLLLAGMLVHLGIWPGSQALLVGAAGALAGDSFYFWLGHGTARGWLTTAHGRRLLPRVERAARRWGIRSIFLARYFYGVRIATMFFWGMHRLSYRKFVTWSALNCFIWAAVLCGLGYLFSTTLQRLTGPLQTVQYWVLLGFLVLAAILIVRHYWARIKCIRRRLANGNSNLRKSA